MLLITILIVAILAVIVAALLRAVTARVTECAVCDNRKREDLRAYSHGRGWRYYLCADEVACDRRVERRTRGSR